MSVIIGESNDNKLIKGGIFRRVNSSNESTDDINLPSYCPFNHIIADVHEKISQTYPQITTGLHYVKERSERDGLVLVCCRDRGKKLSECQCTFRLKAAYLKNCKLSCLIYYCLFSHVNCI
jgi:hypothetical protein